MKNKIWLLLIGIGSGWLSGLFFNLQSSSLLEAYAPGIIFGFAIAIYLILVQKKNFLRSLLFIPISTVAFYIAVQIAGDLFGVPLGGFFLAGVIGATILSATMRMYYKIPTRSILMIALAGGVAGLIFNRVENTTAFIVWQALIAFLFGNEMDMEKQIITHPDEDIHTIRARYSRVALFSIIVIALYIIYTFVFPFGLFSVFTFFGLLKTPGL
jgi:hypothetical protein